MLCPLQLLASQLLAMSYSICHLILQELLSQAKSRGLEAAILWSLHFLNIPS